MENTINLLTPIIKANRKDSPAIYVGTRSGRIRADEMVAMTIANVAANGNIIPWFTNDDVQLSQMDLVFGAGKKNCGSHVDHHVTNFQRPNSPIKYCSSGTLWLQVGEYIGKTFYGLDHSMAIQFGKILDRQVFRWVDAVESGFAKHLPPTNGQLNVPNLSQMISVFDYDNTMDQKEQNKKRKECLKFLTMWMRALFDKTSRDIIGVSKVLKLAKEQDGPVLVMEDAPLPWLTAFNECPDKFDKFKVALIRHSFIPNAWMIQSFPCVSSNLLSRRCLANPSWRGFRKDNYEKPIFISEGVQLTFVHKSGYMGMMDTSEDNFVPMEAALNWIKHSEMKPCAAH